MGKKKPSAKALLAALSNGKNGEANSLLAAGIDINQKIDGMTPLHFLVGSRSSIPGVRWLLQNGASLNERDGNDLTPLMIACARSGKKATEVALALIEAGCDVAARRDDGMSAIEFASKSADPTVIRELVYRGASLDGPQGADVFPALLASRSGNLENLMVLVELGCDLAKRTGLPWAKGLTCLGIARLEKRTPIVRYLEKMGAPE